MFSSSIKQQQSDIEAVRFDKTVVDSIGISQKEGA